MNFFCSCFWFIKNHVVFSGQLLKFHRICPSHLFLWFNIWFSQSESSCSHFILDSFSIDLFSVSCLTINTESVLPDANKATHSTLFSLNAAPSWTPVAQFLLIFFFHFNFFSSTFLFPQWSSCLFVSLSLFHPVYCLYFCSVVSPSLKSDHLRDWIPWAPGWYYICHVNSSMPHIPPIYHAINQPQKCSTWASSSVGLQVPSWRSPFSVA